MSDDWQWELSDPDSDINREINHAVRVMVERHAWLIREREALRRLPLVTITFEGQPVIARQIPVGYAVLREDAPPGLQQRMAAEGSLFTIITLPEGAV